MLVTGLAVVMSVGIFALIPTAIVSARLWRAIKSRHPEVWRNMGGPQLAPMSIGKSRRLRSFIRSRAHEDLADPEVDSYARILRVLNRLLTAAVWVGVVLVLMLAFSADRHARAAIAFPCCVSRTIHASTISLPAGTMMDTDNWWRR